LRVRAQLEDQLKTWVDRYEKLKQSMANFETTLEEKERDIAAKAATVRVLNVSNKLRQVVAVSKSNEIKDLKTEVTAKESEKTKIVCVAPSQSRSQKQSRASNSVDAVDLLRGQYFSQLHKLEPVRACLCAGSQSSSILRTRLVENVAKS
jgi:hypothetical protein